MPSFIAELDQASQDVLRMAEPNDQTETNVNGSSQVQVAKLVKPEQNADGDAIVNQDRSSMIDGNERVAEREGLVVETPEQSAGTATAEPDSCSPPPPYSSLYGTHQRFPDVPYNVGNNRTPDQDSSEREEKKRQIRAKKYEHTLNWLAGRRPLGKW